MHQFSQVTFWNFDIVELDCFYSPRLAAKPQAAQVGTMEQSIMERAEAHVRILQFILLDVVIRRFVRYFWAVSLERHIS